MYHRDIQYVVYPEPVIMYQMFDNTIRHKMVLDNDCNSIAHFVLCNCGYHPDKENSHETYVRGKIKKTEIDIEVSCKIICLGFLIM